MVCYCPERRILYIHLPKCAGLTIESVLIKKYGFKHFTFPDSDDQYRFLRDPRGKIGIFKYILLYSNEARIYDLTSFRKFSIVRNPYNKAESAIRYLHKNNARHNAELEKLKSVTNGSNPMIQQNPMFKEMMKRKMTGIVNNTTFKFPMGIDFFERYCHVNDYYYMHFSLSQSKCLEDLNGIIDFEIGKFEDLMPELRRILFGIYELEEFPIEKVHINKTSRELLNMDINKVREVIKDIHNDDFVNFGYDKDDLTKSDHIPNQIDELLDFEKTFGENANIEGSMF